MTIAVEVREDEPGTTRPHTTPQHCSIQVSLRRPLTKRQAKVGNLGRAFPVGPVVEKENVVRLNVIVTVAVKVHEDEAGTGLDE